MCNKLFAQTVSFGNETGGLAASVTAGQTKVALAGFRVAVSGGSVTFKQFNFTSDKSSNSYLANGTLYRSTTNNFSTGTLTPVGNVIFNGTTITVNGFQETISGTNYYFLVADIINTTADYFQLIVDYNTTFAIDINAVNYQAQFSMNQGYSYNAASPYPISVANQTGEISSSATIVTPGTANTRLFEFTVKNTSTSSITITGLNINSSLSNLSSYLTNFRLYTSANNTFPASSTASGTISSSYVGFTSLTETIASGATKYYWVVADCPNGTAPTDVQFNFSRNQSSTAITTSTGLGAYNTFTAIGNTFSINTAGITVSSQQNGVTAAGTIYGGQSNLPLFGFGVAVTGSTTISSFNINSTNNNLSTYIGNAKLYRSSTNSYNGTLTPIGTATINGSFVNITGLSENISNSTRYYFLVADGIYTGPSASAVTFKFSAGQSTSAITQTGPTSSYNTFSISGNAYTLGATSMSVAAITGGLAGTPILYAQGATAIYGFSIQATGLGTLSAIRITSAAALTTQNYFTNGKLYRNTTNTWGTGTPTLIGTAVFNGSNITVTGMTETIPNTTQYYFLVAEDIYGGTGSVFQPVLNQVTNALATSFDPNLYNGYYTFGMPTTPAISSITGGLLANGSTLIYGQNNLALFGFSLTAYAQLNFTQFSINSNLSLSSYFSNFRLYRNTTNTYGSGTPTLVGTAAINGNFVNITTLNEAFTNNTGQTNYYFLVGDYTNNGGSIPASLQFNFTSGQSTVALTHNSPTALTYNTYNVSGNTYPINSALININGQQNGLGSTTLYGGQTNVAVFGFDITVSGTSTISGININSNNNSLSTYLGNVRLYRSGTNNYTTGSPTLVAQGTINGGFVNFTGLSETFTNQTKYYFLVVDGVYTGNTASSVTFNFTSGQGTNALVQSNPASTYNSFNVTGTAFTLATTTTTIAQITGGVAASPFTYGQTQIAILGFSVQSVGLTTMSAIRIIDNQGRTMSATFANAKLYRSTTSDYTTGALTQVGTANFNGTEINVTGLSESILNTTQYYFVVADDVYYGTTGYYQGVLNQITNAAGTNATYNQFFTSKNYAVPTPTVTVSGNNDVANGLYNGPLSYGQTNLVLFSFKVSVLGVTTITRFKIPSTVNVVNYFTNVKVYRSTDQYFSHATQVTASGSFSTNSLVNVSESFTDYVTPTVYYYFIVADFTANTTHTAPNTLKFNFSTSDALSTSNGSVSATTTDGLLFTVLRTYEWRGGTSNSFTVAGNFKTLTGAAGAVPGALDVVRIGSYNYGANAPVIATNTNIGGLSFGTVVNPTVTVSAGATLTLAQTFEVSKNANVSITGPGALALSNTAVSGVDESATLTLNNTAMGNAGTFNISSTGKLALTNNATVSNSGTFTLKSDVNGSATISALSGTSALTGSYRVERFITGNGSLTNRGYRLLSSAVSDTVGYYALSHLKGIGSYLTGTNGTTNGFDVAGNPTLYLYRDDKTPSGTSFTSGNYRAINKINNTPKYKLTTVDGDYKLPVGVGFMYFFRGNNGTVTTTVPTNVIITDTGTLNQGQITVKNWVTKSDTLGFTKLASAAAVQGFNLVGNPYPSSIDWNTHYNNSTSNNGTGIYAKNFGHAIYIYNATTKNYSIYTSTSSSTGVASGSPGGSSIIPSGQGFFIRAIDSIPKLIFNESAKVSTQVTGSNLLLGTPLATNYDQHLRLQLAKDSVNKDETVILFNQNAKPTYNAQEDVPYLKGTGVVSLANLSSDKKTLAINQLALPASKDIQRIKLSVAGTGDGIYDLNMTEVTNIPDLYEVWLMDAYKKDSLDIKHNPNYKFNIAAADTGTTSANRFTLVIRQNSAYAYRLLDFTAKKAANNVELTWKAENENDYTYFTVERSVDGGKTFNIIASERANGLGNYSVIDKAAISGENIYRLKQEDINGLVTYSNRISVVFEKSAVGTTLADITIYPNPTSSLLNIQINKKDNVNGNVQITITNSSGRVVLSTQSSQKLWSKELADLLPGSYFVNVINERDKSIVGRGSFIKL